MRIKLPNISFRVNDQVFLKDPDTSKLGKKIVSGSIDLIEEIGFESFTFAKLARKIESTEASVYRYFESKHKLLLYLTIWYWSWMNYRLTFGLANIDSPQTRLEKAIKLVTEEIAEDSDFSHINEIKLNKIIISEASKVYMTKDVDEENKVGVFLPYKELVEKIGDVILEINPDYKYPHMLISTIVEGAHHQRFFADHLPRLTDTHQGEDSIVTFSINTVFNAIKSE